jgi:translation initiation factor IF-3
MASPPVVRFLDFGQYKYELTKREKEAKRRQRAVEFKEVRLTPKIGSGDFLTKVHRAVEFLEDGDRIKVTVRFRGRELTHPELGRNLLLRFADQIKEHGTVERAPTLEGKQMHITVASVHKPKVHEPAARGPRPDDASDSPNGTPATPPGPNGAAPAAAEPPTVDEPTAEDAPPVAATRAKPAETKTKTTQTPTAASAATGD